MIGADLSPEMVAQVHRSFPAFEFRVADATSFTVAEPQDAVFSNAVLHWVRPPEAAVLARSPCALRPGGRFVAEFGGQGCVAQIIAAMNAASATRTCHGNGIFPASANTAPILEQHGFEVRFATLFDRPTPLEDGEQGLRNWLRMFAGSFLCRWTPSVRRPCLPPSSVSCVTNFGKKTAG